MERIKTGIKGFDKLIDGGFPESSVVLLSGTAGTGKTILSLEYIYRGATEFKEKGIYFTFEEKKEALYEQAIQFGWNLKDLEKKKKIQIINIGSEDFEKSTISEMVEIISRFKAKRVVIDSLTTLSYLSPENSGTNVVTNYTIKKFLYSFITKFKESGKITALFISQQDEKISDNIAKYLCDGVVNIYYESVGGDYSRSIVIRKMRKTNNNDNLHPIEISKNGVIVHSLFEGE